MCATVLSAGFLPVRYGHNKPGSDTLASGLNERFRALISAGLPPASGHASRFTFKLLIGKLGDLVTPCGETDCRLKRFLR